MVLQIMETNTSKPWDTSWYNKYDSVFAKKKKKEKKKKPETIISPIVKI